MIVKRFVLTAFQQNTRVLACETTRHAICIDPGERSDELESYIKTEDLNLQAIALTHGHLGNTVNCTRLASCGFPFAIVLAILAATLSWLRKRSERYLSAIACFSARSDGPIYPAETTNS